MKTTSEQQDRAGHCRLRAGHRHCRQRRLQVHQAEEPGAAPEGGEKEKGGREVAAAAAATAAVILGARGLLVSGRRRQCPRHGRRRGAEQGRVEVM